MMEGVLGNLFKKKNNAAAGMQKLSNDVARTNKQVKSLIAQYGANQKKIKQLEQTMYRHARDLEFEAAAKLRDEIQRIRQFGLGMPTTKAE